MPTIPRIIIPAGALLPSGAPVSETVKKIINSRENNGGRTTAHVPTMETLADLYSAALPLTTMTFDTYIDGLQNKAVSNVNDANTYLTSVGQVSVNIPTGAAFNNCNGKWTEDGYAVFAWNSLAKLNRASRAASNGNPYDVYVYVKLPNRTSEEKDWTQLLHNNITSALAAYPTAQSARVVPPSSNVGRKFELISSNPDSVIIRFDDASANGLWANTGITSFDLYTDITAMTVSVINDLNTLFEKFKGTVIPSKNLQCFLSVKRSTRPDRRYQWIHEGDHVKTILQWIQVSSSMNPVSPLDRDLEYSDLNGKFFAVSLSDVSDADKEAMNTGLVGSIVTPSLAPIWAVDKLFKCRSFDKIDAQINEMLTFR